MLNNLPWKNLLQGLAATTLPLAGCAGLGLAAEAGTPNVPTPRPGYAGYDQPNQYLGRPTTPVAPNFMPVMSHQAQDDAVKQKLADYEKKTGKKPNLLIFLMDDVGWFDFGFNGGGISVGNHTPNADALASQGLILTSAYSQPTSSPTRATIMTGQYAPHHGIVRPPMYGQPGGLQGATTLPELLRRQGYTTQAIGKWHIGENKETQPQNVGFDDFRGFCSVSDMYTEWRDPVYNPEVALSPLRYQYINGLPFNKCDVHATRGGELENLAEITPKYMEDLDQRWMAYGVDFLKRQANSDKPFFLYYNTRAAHFDNYPNRYYAGRSAARTVYSDVIVEIDDIFGTLVKTLEETGQLENTLIIFTSDNGPEQEVPPYGRTAFRGGKGSTWEGGMRVPTFVYWKGMIEPRKSDGLFDMSDLLPTFMHLAGKPGKELVDMIPEKTYIDGVDQTSFLLGTDGQSNRKTIHYFWNDQLAAVRVDEFKFHVLVQQPFAFTQRGQQGGVTGAIMKSTGSVLFNLYTNPQEDDSIGLRHVPMGIPLEDEYVNYMKVLKKYPAKVQLALN